MVGLIQKEAAVDASAVMLTSIDNPYSPFTDFRRWYLHDITHYNVSALLAQVVILHGTMTADEMRVSIEEAIDEIVRENVLGIYVKVVLGEEAFSSS